MNLSIESFIKENKVTFMLICATIFFLMLVMMIALKIFINKREETSKGTYIARMVSISIFSALSVLLYLFLKFPLPFLPSFLKINFSNLPLLIITFMLGPIDGIVVLLIRTIIVLPFSHTFGVGEIADVIISLAIIIVVSIIYIRNKTKKGAYISLGFAVITWVIVAVFANYIILIPAYIMLMFNGNVEILINMLNTIDNVNSDNYMIKYLLYGALPFNLILSIVVCFITALIYKRISILFHKFEDKENNKNSVSD